jgi:hypothetical protein
MFEMTQLVAVFKKLFSARTYGQELESYISSRYPQNEADVERLTQQYQQLNSGGVLWR